MTVELSTDRIPAAPIQTNWIAWVQQSSGDGVPLLRSCRREVRNRIRAEDPRIPACATRPDVHRPRKSNLRACDRPRESNDAVAIGAIHFKTNFVSLNTSEVDRYRLAGRALSHIAGDLRTVHLEIDDPWSIRNVHGLPPPGDLILSKSFHGDEQQRGGTEDASNHHQLSAFR